MSGYVNSRNYGIEDSREIERIFLSDVREKKRAGYGAFHKTGKGGERAGVKGGLRFAGDSLRGKEKKEYKGTTKARAYNLNDFMPKEAFLNLSEADQKTRLEHWRNTYTNQEIIEGVGFNKNDIYDLIYKLKLPKKDRRPRLDGDIKAMEQQELDAVKKTPSKLGHWNRFKLLPMPQRDEIVLYWTQQMNWQAADLADLIEGAQSKDIHQASWTARDRKKKKDAREADKQQKLEEMQATQEPPKEEPKQDTFTFDEIEGMGEKMQYKESVEERALRLKEQEETLMKLDLDRQETKELIKDIKEKVETIKPAPAQPPLAQTEIQIWENLKELASTAMEPKEVMKEETHGFYLTHNGDFFASELERRLQNVLTIIHGTESKYELKLELREVEQPQPIEAEAEEVEGEQPPAKALAEAFANLGEMLNQSFFGNK